MEQSQFVQLIRALSTEQMEYVLHFAANPFHNQGKLKAFVPTFLQLCLNQVRDQPDDAFEKDIVYAQLFPQQSIVEGKLEKVMAEAHKVVRDALLTREYLASENEFQQTLDFAQWIRKQGMRSRFENLLTKLKKIHSEQPVKNPNYYQQAFLLESAIHEEENFQNQIKTDLNIHNVMYALKNFDHINRFALLNKLLIQTKVARIELSEEILPIMEESMTITEFYLQQSPIIRINHIIFQLLRKENPDAADIEHLYQTLLQYQHELDQERLQEFYAYLRNISILVLNTDRQNMDVEYVLNNLYKDNLIRGYLHYEGKLHSSRYWAVSSNALRIKDFDWASDFIERYKDDLIDENESKDLYRFNLANYYFYTGAFQQCLDVLPDNSSFLEYMITGKSLELKCYYELDSELFTYKLESFKVFLSRTSPKILSPAKKQQLVDFANLLAQIASSIPGDKKRSELVVKRVEMKNQAANWPWLLEKAKQIAQK